MFKKTKAIKRLLPCMTPRGPPPFSLSLCAKKKKPSSDCCLARRPGESCRGDAFYYFGFQVWELRKIESRRGSACTRVHTTYIRHIGEYILDIGDLRHATTSHTYGTYATCIRHTDTRAHFLCLRLCLSLSHTHSLPFPHGISREVAS